MFMAIQQGTTSNSSTATALRTTSSGPQSAATRSWATTWAPGPRASGNPSNSTTPASFRCFCNVHPDMSGYLIVSPTPYFAVTDKSGEYKIDNVPDGAYTVTVWNEGAKSKSNPVKVAGDTAADFTLSK
jgi:hypothetical protein